MDAVDRTIAAFHTATVEAKGESWPKCSAIEELQDHLADPRVLDFFLNIVADTDEYDMARVEVLKILELDPLPKKRSRIAAVIAAALSAEPDLLVRQWLGRAVAAYLDVPKARAAALARVLDPDEEQSVQCNCIVGLGRERNHPAVAKGLAKIAASQSLLASAARDELKKPIR